MDDKNKEYTYGTGYDSGSAQNDPPSGTTPAENEYRYSGSEIGRNSTPDFIQSESAPDYRYENKTEYATDHNSENRKAKNKKNGFLRTVAAALAVIVVGGAAGFGGSFVYDKYLGSSSDPYVAPQQPSVSANNTSSNGTMSISQLVTKTQSSVVEIVTETVSYGSWMGQYVSEGAGSGVIISSDGYIVTCNHVIDGASKVIVTTSDGTEYQATLVGADSETDLAVLKIEASGLSAVTLGTSADLQVGDFVIAIGNPLGELGGTVTNGIISALSRDVTIDGDTMTLLQTNAAVNPGNSGGALFDENGNLVGIVNAKSSGDDVEGIGFAIPVDLVRTVMEDLINQGYVGGRFALGVSIVEIADERTAMMYRVDSLGVYVKAIQEGGNAQLAGMQVGDRIVRFNGREITTYDELSAALTECEVDQTVEVAVERDGSQYTLKVTLYESKS